MWPYYRWCLKSCSKDINPVPSFMRPLYKVLPKGDCPNICRLRKEAIIGKKTLGKVVRWTIFILGFKVQLSPIISYQPSAGFSSHTIGVVSCQGYLYYYVRSIARLKSLTTGGCCSTEGSHNIGTKGRRWRKAYIPANVTLAEVFVRRGLLDQHFHLLRNIYGFLSSKISTCRTWNFHSGGLHKNCCKTSERSFP